MKRYGEYGFTFDSKAEEWVDWCISVWEHNAPRTSAEETIHLRMANAYVSDYARHTLTSAPRDHMGDFARHSPSQAQNNTGIGVGPRNRVLWPLLAGSALVVAVAVGMVLA